MASKKKKTRPGGINNYDRSIREQYERRTAREAEEAAYQRGLEEGASRARLEMGIGIGKGLVLGVLSLLGSGSDAKTAPAGGAKQRAGTVGFPDCRVNCAIPGCPEIATCRFQPFANGPLDRCQVHRTTAKAPPCPGTPT